MAQKDPKKSSRPLIHQIERVQGQLDNLSRGDKILDSAGSIAHIKTIADLEKLRDTLKQSEDHLLSQLPESITNFKQLQSKVFQWTAQSQVFFSQRDQIVNEIWQHMQDNYVDPNLLSEAIIEVASDFILENEDVKDKIDLEIVKAINQATKGKSNLSVSSTGGFRGRLEIGEVTANPQIKFNTSNMTAANMKKTAEAINSYIIQHNNNSSKQLKTVDIGAQNTIYDEVYLTLKRYGIITPARDSLWKKEIYNNQKVYFISKDKNNIRGYLGEIYWNVFFNYLLQGKGNTMPVGNIKDLDNKSLPIDLILYQVGFQVKNYKIEQGRVTFHNQVNDIDSFFNRTMIKAPLSQILRDFFNYYKFGYNFTNDMVYGSTNNYFRSNSENLLDQIFTPYVPNLIRVESPSNTEPLLIKKALLPNNNQLNSVFLIGEYIVPASLIVQAVIDTYNDEVPNLCKIQVSYLKSKTVLYEENQQMYENIRTNLINTGNDSLFEELYKKLKFHYSIELDVVEILKKAMILSKNYGILKN